MNMNYSINSVQGSIHQASETFSEHSREGNVALSALFHNESVLVHSWTKSSLIKYPMETACIRIHFQTIKYPIPILFILCICRWLQNSFYDSKFTASYGDGSTTLLIEND